MGKAKPRHKNNRKHKSQPTGVPSLKDTESEENELKQFYNEDELALQNIIEEIQSTKGEERLCGLQSLVTLSEKPESIDTIIKLKVLKIIGPLLVDPNSEVRNFTAGILRNLSACGSVDILERLVKDDIMTPLIALLNQYSDWKPESSKSENTDTLLQVVNIIWNLCENDDSALKYFNSANLLNILLKCLDFKTVGLDLTITVCQCLNSVSEDNGDVITALRGYETELLGLLSITSGGSKFGLLKTLVAGIIVNINPSSSWLAPVLSVVHEALSRDIKTLVSQLSSQLPLEAPIPTYSLPAEVQTLLDDCEALTDAQIRALEILTNLTASQDDEMDVESDEFLSEDEDEVNGWCEAGDSQLLTLSPEIHEGLIKFNLVQSVFSKIEPLPENVMDIINNCHNSKSLSKKIKSLQCRAFLCFNNLVSVTDVEQLGGPDRLFSLVPLIAGQRLPQNPQQTIDSSVELVEASTAAIRAILLRLASVNYVVREISPADLEVMFKVGLINEPRVQANVIRIVGTLGALLVNSDSMLMKMASNYLLELAEKQQALWLTAEAIDALLDMFAEDDTDQVAAELNLVPRLQAIAPRLKSKVRQERKTLGDNYPVVSTVMSNLNPFIKYKGTRVANLRKQ